jgi:hypothetical protein
MIRQAIKKGQLYVNYLGPSSALIGNLIATPILISNLGLKNWSIFALINILLPLVYIVLFGSGEFVRRFMINISLGNDKTKQSINIFYIYEKKIFIRFVFATIFLSLTLILFKSNNYSSHKTIEVSFLLASIAVLIKIFEFYYSELLNGLKQHYKLHLYAFIITILKWAAIIYLSLEGININILLITLIIFSCLLLIIQRILILNVFEKKQKQLTKQNNKIFSEFNEKNFGMTIFLILIIQKFHNILVFGIFDPLTLSYFGIAFMLSTAIPLIISPFIVYLTPEMYEKVEINLNGRKKIFSKLIILQFIILFIMLIIVNLFLEQILFLWLGKSINSVEISKYLIPLSISAFSISLLNSIKILFIAENKITLMQKPLILIFFLYIFLTIMIFLQTLTVEFFLYSLSISMFFLMIYFYFIFFIKKYTQ